MNYRYRVVVEVTKTSTQGWDSYEDSWEFNIEGDTKEEAVALAEAYIKEAKYDRYGDFGICLSREEAKIVRIEKYCIVEEYNG